MEAEPKSKKTGIMVGACCNLIAMTTIGGLYAARWANVSQLQTAWEGDSFASTTDKNYIYYDVQPFLNRGNTWSDT